MSKARKKVALFLTGGGFCSREVLAGVLAYVRENPSWDARFMWQLGPRRPGSASIVGRWRPEGAIVYLDKPGRIKVARRLGIPLVNVDDGREATGIPTVIGDNRKAGVLVAEHFIQRGFKHFGFIDNGTHYARLRMAGFAQTLRAATLGCEVLRHPVVPTEYGEIDRRRMQAWLRGQPKPLAVMACYDLFGAHLVNLCNEIGIKVPDDVSVVGVDDDETLCSFCPQPLSSVAMANKRIGYQAAALLADLMDGAPAPGSPVLLEPAGLIVRHSSDSTGVPDEVVREAMRFIRSHAGQKIGVPDVLTAVPVCRSILNRKFQAVLGRSPAKEILRTRLELAKGLLTQTQLKVQSIAGKAGFGGYRVFYRSFCRHVGLSPAQYRARSAQRQQA